MIATCVCGKRLYRPEIANVGGPVLGAWQHRTERWHHPTSRPIQQIPGQMELFGVVDSNFTRDMAHARSVLETGDNIALAADLLDLPYEDIARVSGDG
jgi:hypothetical protein